MASFQELIEGLGRELHLPLAPDKNNACLLEFKNGVRVQMEPSPDNESLIMVALLGEVPAGRFREDVMVKALKYNALQPRTGTLSFSQPKHQLALFERFSLEHLSIEILKASLIHFVEVSYNWTEGLKRGSLPEVEVSSSSSKPSIFDVKKKS